MENIDYFKSDLTRLHNLGVNLINAMQVEQFSEEMEAHFTNTLKKTLAHLNKAFRFLSRPTRHGIPKPKS